MRRAYGRSTRAKLEPYIPSPEQLDVEGSKNLKATDVLIAVLLDTDWVKSIAGWRPLGPNSNSGGCRGVEVTFTFHLDSPTLQP